MLRYLPLSDLARFGGAAFPKEVLTENGAFEVRKLLQVEEIRSQLQNLGYTAEDLRFYEERVSPESLLFQQWIESNQALLAFLTEGKVENYEDKQGIASHRLLQHFKQFISPYLSEKLLNFPQNSSENILLQLSSYLPLLDEDHCAVVEDAFFAGTRRRLLALQEMTLTISSEQELLVLVQPLCSDAIILQLNSLSKASYVHKMNYVDTLLNTIHAPGCTPRFANWLIKRLELLELNAEHQDKIRSLKRDLAEGKIKVYNTTHLKGNKSGKIIGGAVLLLVGAAVFSIWYFKPFSDQVEDPNINGPSSFAEFSEQERREIDSIIQEMNQHGVLTEGDEADPGVFYGGSTVLTLRKAFQNALMEQIYDDLSADARLNYIFPTDSCSEKSGYNSYKGVLPLSLLKGGKKCSLRNESDYEAVIYVAENRSNGKVFAGKIKSGETLSFPLRKGDVFTLVIGKNYTRFTPPKGATSEQLPSAAYTHHFCETDANFEESINTSFKLSEFTKAGKFVLVGKTGNEVRFIDVTHISELY